MTQVEKLNHIGILGSVRQRLGGENQDDETYDAKINKMSNSQCIAALSGWELGDEAWWKEYKSKFDMLEELGEKMNEDENEVQN